MGNQRLRFSEWQPNMCVTFTCIQAGWSLADFAFSPLSQNVDLIILGKRKLKGLKKLTAT
jgi:hypothetical protein